MRKPAVEYTGPNPDIIEMTKSIIEQNTKILEINAELISIWSTPTITHTLQREEETP